VTGTCHWLWHAPPNQSLNLTGAAFWFRAVCSRCSGPGKLALSFADDNDGRSGVDLTAGTRTHSQKRGSLMTTSVSFRLSAAFVVLSLSVLTSVGRCAGQEIRREVDSPAVLRGADDARRPADLRAGTRVLSTSVRAALLLLRDPDDAYQLVKTVRDAIRADPDISESCRERLESRLEWVLSGEVRSGPFIKRLEYERLALTAAFRAHLDRLRFQIEQWKFRLGLLLGPE
jgi:hypothetical protein